MPRPSSGTVPVDVLNAIPGLRWADCDAWRAEWLPIVEALGETMPGPYDLRVAPDWPTGYVLALKTVTAPHHHRLVRVP